MAPRCIVFLAEGVVNAFVSLAHRSTRGWGLANGLVTLVLGAMILSLGLAGLLSVIGPLLGRGRSAKPWNWVCAPWGDAGGDR